ncbi:RNA polymerase, sigma 54 subunit, RpoN/SigL [Nannocystis exedens]|uniref:RNA polymerase, sigma 54 subunit, RpoN/SigL n=1 Tax=Nannocystis exedens TaxID=54 RepID=A0A1I1W9M6_9BACT|nr:RNA polymerase factor sigma-54 [Nannocystis exedens]PCC67550.1 RNA polymerase sigma-54 factor [Nannocystis exedens]SFD91812.1 RNA polymerase, sigma 54 subunit, RpoN/SigL [Nannocystis exedens]
MALQMRQDLRMSTQLVMTPQLQQAIKLLQLSRPELVDLVRSELMENPLLEEAHEIGTSAEEPVSSVELQDAVDAPQQEAAGGEPDRSAPEVKVDEVPKEGADWEAYADSMEYLPPSAGSTTRTNNEDEEGPSIEATLTRAETLAEHLMWQVRLSNFGETGEEVAEYIVRCLSPAGYLQESAPQIARKLGVSTLKVEMLVRKIQQLDPVAIGSRNLAECLWVQANHPEHPVEDPLVRAIIAKHLHNLEIRNYQAVARDTGEALEEVYEATKVIMGMDPRPARAYGVEAPQYITPDVYIIKVGDEFVVTLNDDGLPRLRISGLYKEAVGEHPKAKEYIHERMRSAQWLIRSIQQRQRTIVKVTRSILKFQREFFERGPQHLRPLILKDVAEDIEMHESTVSRVTTNKYVHTPQGIFELKYFFNAGISRTTGDDLASEAVKERIKKLIDAEDEAHPYSDQRLVELLQEEGIDIARRTVAKYREQLGVLSSAKRRKLF